MHIITLDSESAVPITEYHSRAARAQLLGDGYGESHFFAVHIAPGGHIGPHPAGFGQLFCAIAGAGWVAGADGVRHELRPGQAAVIARGEPHAKGSDTGLTALMLQVADLVTAPDAG
ncbi:MAG: cupin domain-containing protein [Gemmatimonadetes bacterium]|jgi:quercetin dioxygenase-like cupin family protein|nr:cupin domain-containing protein [Gemmatimonadota bacterium]MCC6771207.1 cupin domain-containing protein [Gemmatimonadaceae bacterium]